MTEGAATGNEFTDEGGDPACWAHLFADDEELEGASDRGERDRPAHEPAGQVVDGGVE
jgi:hypothetical protein